MINNLIGSHGLIGIIKSACSECRMFGSSDNIGGKTLDTMLDRGKINILA
jgi:hypothetical protein